ncbi:uncharacterized protein [Heliangelus exortis]|uniref:uncharacterized protein n=1 Tax=Heliangelus exortis TaxID=472823 RepID=UPI003A94427C
MRPTTASPTTAPAPSTAGPTRTRALGLRRAPSRASPTLLPGPIPPVPPAPGTHSLLRSRTLVPDATAGLRAPSLYRGPDGPGRRPIGARRAGQELMGGAAAAARPCPPLFSSPFCDSGDRRLLWPRSVWWVVGSHSAGLEDDEVERKGCPQGARPLLPLPWPLQPCPAVRRGPEGAAAGGEDVARSGQPRKHLCEGTEGARGVCFCLSAPLPVSAVLHAAIQERRTR